MENNIRGMIITPTGATGITDKMRVVNLPWINDGRYYEMTTGKSPLVMKDYTKSAWATAVMEIRATEISRIPWHIKRNDQIVEGSQVEKVLLDFGPESNYIQAMKATETDLLLHGAAYWLRDVDIIRRLNPSTIKVETDNDGIKYFEQKINGKVANRFSRDEVVYFREYHPDDDLGPGIPFIKKCQHAIEIEYLSSLMIENLFLNNGIPGLLLTTEQDIPQEEQERILRRWINNMGGPKNKGKTAIADKGLSVQVISNNMEDNAVTKIRDQAREDICAAARVATPLVGAMNEATYVNANESRKLLLEDVILPRAKEFAAVINADWIKKVDSSLYLEFAEDEIQVLQEDTSEKWSRLKEAYELGIITQDYLLREMGWTDGKAISDNRTLNKWMRKAIRSLKEEGTASVDFETDDIPINVQAALHTKLMSAETPEEVEKIFYEH